MSNLVVLHAEGHAGAASTNGEKEELNGIEEVSDEESSEDEGISYPVRPCPS